MTNGFTPHGGAQLDPQNCIATQCGAVVHVAPSHHRRNAVATAIHVYLGR